MNTILVKNVKLVNRGESKQADILIRNGRFEKIDSIIDANCDVEINAKGMIAMPGIIDDQVHFREPGFPHKATIGSEARAGVAGGVTSFMEMPNTRPPATTQELLEEKYQVAAKTSLANYSFFMGAANDNLDEVLRTDGKNVCGVKIFMGSSTGNMLVDNERALEGLFSQVPLLIATHCEDETTVRTNLATYQQKYGNDIPISAHPEIRSVKACLKSSTHAIELAKKHNTRLHILHISTADETQLFRNDIPLKDKRITSEVCVHHLYFNASQYDTLGTQIKCNPAIKAEHHRQALWQALTDDRFDVIATDHAPHAWQEKQGNYVQAPSGLPLLQHSLNMMLSFEQQGLISLERIVEKMCHAVADCFRIYKRGYVDEGYWADLVLVDPEHSWMVNKDNILHHCGWSPLEGTPFKGKVNTTIVSGHIAYRDGRFYEEVKGERLKFRDE